MGLPIKHHNKHRKGNRRSHHALKPRALSRCSTCQAVILAHRACLSCLQKQT